jgi:hypothetical protein
MILDESDVAMVVTSFSIFKAAGHAAQAPEA